MILVDTSAWVEFLRGTGSPVCDRVEELLGVEIAICDAVRMEVLAGARDENHLQSLRRLLARATLIRVIPTDYDDAVALFRRCRRAGVTIRKLVDCRIAAVAIRVAVPVLHSDGDFDALAGHTALRIAS